jgi:hypothetical protein
VPLILLEASYHIAAVAEIWFALGLITGVQTARADRGGGFVLLLMRGVSVRGAAREADVLATAK